MTRDEQTLLRPIGNKLNEYKQTLLIFFLFVALLFLSGQLRAQEVEFKLGSEAVLTIEKNAFDDVRFQTSSNDGNLFMGYQAGLVNGQDSVSANDGASNTGFGNYVLQKNTSGISNTAVGIWSLSENVDGNSNTAMGWSALQFNTSGGQNTAFGISSLRSNETGAYNTAVGQNALGGMENGSYNLGIGSRSGVFVTGGSRNILIGSNAGAGGNTSAEDHTKSNSVMIGYDAGSFAKGSDNVFLGHEAGKNESGDHKLYIANVAGDSSQALIYGEFDNELIRLNGKVIMRDGFSDTDCDTYVEVEKTADDDKVRMTVAGDEVVSFEKNSSGYFKVQNSFNERNTLFGYNAGNNIGIGADGTTLGVNEGKYNTAFGAYALRDQTIGVANTAMGVSALTNVESGSSNVAVGSSALQELVSGFNNVGVGEQALLSNTGSGMTAVGRGALNSSVAGSNSVAVGFRTGAFDTQARQSVYIGYSAGAGGSTFSDAHTKQNNVMVGYNSGQQAQGDGNVFLGYESGKNEAGDNKLYISNSDADANNALIYGEFDNDLLRVNGTIDVNGAYSLPTVDGVADYVLTTDGSGNVSWLSDNAGPWQLEAGDDCVYEDGDVGIGIGNPIYRLDVNDSSGSYIARIDNTSTSTFADGLIIEIGPTANPGTLNDFVIFRDGNGTVIGSVDGNGSGGVNYNTTSDRRLKMNIENYTAGLDLISEMTPREYERKSLPGKKEIGFIAQELFEVFPQAVAGTPDNDIEDPMMVNYSTMTPVLVAALKEQQAQIEALQQQLSEKDAAYDELRSEVAAIRAMLAK